MYELLAIKKERKNFYWFCYWIITNQ